MLREAILGAPPGTSARGVAAILVQGRIESKEGWVEDEADKQVWVSNVGKAVRAYLKQHTDVEIPREAVILPCPSFTSGEIAQAISAAPGASGPEIAKTLLKARIKSLGGVPVSEADMTRWTRNLTKVVNRHKKKPPGQLAGAPVAKKARGGGVDDN